MATFMEERGFEGEPVRCPTCGREIIATLVERKKEVFTYRLNACSCGKEVSPPSGSAVFGIEGGPLMFYPPKSN